MSKKISLVFAISILLIAGCDDFIAKKISGETPVIILPAANDTIPSNPVQFKWQEIKGATKYHIEIVSPGFSNIQSFPIDSIVTTTNFSVGLDSNMYEVRITAMNAGYTSNTSLPRAFVVGTSQGSSTNGVVLISPADRAYFNASFNTSNLFSWQILPDAISYTFEFHKDSTFAGQTLDFQDQLGTHSTNYQGTDYLSEGVYSWGVKAFKNNGTTETAYSKRIIYIDTTSPGNATLTTPSNGATLNAGSVTFNWSLPTDLGTIQSPLISHLEIATDVNFNSLYVPVQVSSTNSKVVSMAAGTYYWRVKMIDEAGNNGSVPTSHNTLTIIP